jgi:hypothetical protein
MISATSRASLDAPRIAFAAVAVVCMVLWSWRPEDPSRCD